MKKSLLDLIPANKGLHSALFTTFSLDGYFLENLVSKWRSKGIVNILGVADGIMFDESFGQVYAPMNLGKSYMVLGYPTEHLLHSKTYLFVGKENALLIIGSGNVSMHGFGKNLETFNYFFFAGPADPKAPLLLDCWNYLKSRLIWFDPEALMQLKWIKEEASWIEKLSSTPGEPWVILENDDAISFIANNESIGTLHQIVNRIPADEINRITILSPFHDPQGASVVNLKKVFKSAEIRVILQRDYGVAPQKIVAENILLFDYKEVVEGESGKVLPQHSHSKLYLFEGARYFYVYSGSANSTVAGLGTMDKTGNNEEAGILWRTAPFNIEEYFGFNFRQEPKNLDYFQNKEKPKDPYSHRQLAKYFIKAAILDTSSLKIKLNKPLLEEYCALKIYDQEYNEIHSFSLLKKSDGFSWQLDKIPGKEFCSVMIVDAKGDPLTRKQILLNKDYLRRTNPSEKNRFVGKAEEALSSGLLNDPSILEAIIALFSYKEETKKKKIILTKKKVMTEKEEKAGSTEFTKEELEQAILELLENEKNNNQSERDFLESIEAATRRVIEGSQEEAQDNEAEATENANPKPPKEKGKPKEETNETEMARIKKRLDKIWHTAFLIGKNILEKGITAENEFLQELISINLSFFTFFAFGYNSYNIKKEGETKSINLYPDYGHFTELESRYAIFQTLCGTTLNILPFIKAYDRDPEVKKYLNSMVAQVLVGICVFWEKDESKQSVKETVLSEIYINLNHFIPKEILKEIDLFSMANRIMIQNHNAIEIPPDVLISVPEMLEERIRSIAEPEYFLLKDLGYFKVEEYLPTGEFVNAKSFLLKRMGFPYLIDSTGSIPYKRWYNKQKGIFFEGAKRTMSGYDKRVGETIKRKLA